MKYTVSITPPNVKQIFFTNQAKTAVAIEWDQPVKWDSKLISRFYLDGVAGKVTAGSVSGNVMTLTLSAPSTATKLTYLDSRYNWNADSASFYNNIIWGVNDIAALTFCNVTISSSVRTFEPRAAGKLPLELNVYQNKSKIIISTGTVGAVPLTIELVNMSGQTVVRKKATLTGSRSEAVVLPKVQRGIYVLAVKGIGYGTFLKKMTVF